MPRRPTPAPLVALLALAAAPAARGQNADFIWFGGPILAGKDVRAEVLAVKDGKIVALGPREDVEKRWKGKSTLPIDLNGQALVAGLVAGSPSAASPAPSAKGRAHAAAAIVKAAPRPTPPPPVRPAPPPAPALPAPPIEALAADLSPPGGGLPYTITTLRDALRAWMLRSRLPARHKLVLGVGYDETKLEEKRHPTRQELDTVSATMPVIAVSKSGEAGAYNTLALQRAGISWRTKDPPGGVIRRGRIAEPNGVLEGTAHAAAYAKLVPALDAKERSRLLSESLRLNEAEEPAAPVAEVAAATPVPTPAPAPTPASAPPAAAAPEAPSPALRDAGSPAVAALAADALEGRAPLAVGAPATLSVLSADPATGDPVKREKLRVVEEVRQGRTVWRRDRP